MRRKWTIKLAAPILALGLVSACGTANDHNDNTPQNKDNAPQNIKYQQDQVPNNNNMRQKGNNNGNTPDMPNNDNINAPDHNRNLQPSVDNNKDNGSGPQHGTGPTDNFQH